MISILLPVYNGERYINESIDSILNQTFSRFELLIGFNGTTDKSIDIVKSYKDERIKIFDYGDDKGKPKTLNKLLKESKYDWIALQDDDDIWVKDKLEKQIKFINYDVIGTQILYCDSNSNILSNSPIFECYDNNIKSKTINGNNQIANSSALIKKSSLLNVNGWDESLIGLEDFDLWIRLIKNKNKFFNLNENLIIHRIHKNSNFNTMNNQNISMMNILKKNKIIC